MPVLDTAYSNPFASVEETSDDQLPTDKTTVIDLTIPRETAMQIVGVLARREQRFHPTSMMTKNVSVLELAQIEVLTQSYLIAEINRPAGNRSRLPTLKVSATPDQAATLRKMCRNYATQLQQKIDPKGDAPSCRDSKRRINKAWDVVRQINRALGYGDDGGCTPRELRTEVASRINQLAYIVVALISRAKRVTNNNPEELLSRDKINFWEEFHHDLNSALKELARYEKPHDSTNCSSSPGENHAQR